jgi:propanol-preferring alcohol dehydrogenase
MLAMVFDGTSPVLRETQVADPVAGAGELLIDVHACGVCRTDLHVVDRDLTEPKIPLIPGHEIVGVVVAVGDGVHDFKPGDRVGVPWLGHTCGHCSYCLRYRENLCDHPGFTGYTIDGGYAEQTVADSRYCLHLPPDYADAEAAPLLCAGVIGFRTLEMAGDARAHRYLRVWRGGAYRRSGRSSPGTHDLRVHAPGRYRGTTARASIRRTMGRE